MKFVLQNISTGLYLGACGTWSSDVNSAMAFPNFTLARGYGIERGLADSRIVGLAGNDSEEFASAAPPAMFRSRFG